MDQILRVAGSNQTKKFPHSLKKKNTQYVYHIRRLKHQILLQKSHFFSKNRDDSEKRPKKGYHHPNYRRQLGVAGSFAHQMTSQAGFRPYHCR
jgi:hypothetical protein